VHVDDADRVRLRNGKTVQKKPLPEKKQRRKQAQQVPVQKPAIIRELFHCGGGELKREQRLFHHDENCSIPYCPCGGSSSDEDGDVDMAATTSEEEDEDDDDVDERQQTPPLPPPLFAQLPEQSPSFPSRALSVPNEPRSFTPRLIGPLIAPFVEYGIEGVQDEQYFRDTYGSFNWYCGQGAPSPMPPAEVADVDKLASIPELEKAFKKLATTTAAAAAAYRSG
jgi:hypothetical protein